jgi:hypothetical protein
MVSFTTNGLTVQVLKLFKTAKKALVTEKKALVTD